MPTQAKTPSSNKKKLLVTHASREVLVLALGEQLSALMSASRALMADASATFHPDLPPAAFHIAQWLHSFGAAKVSKVAEAVAMDRSATSRLTAKLITLGLVEALPDPADGRGVVLGLTEFGRKSINHAIAQKGDVFYRKIEGWSDVDLQLFAAYLRRFNELPKL